MERTYTYHYRPNLNCEFQEITTDRAFAIIQANFGVVSPILMTMVMFDSVVEIGTGQMKIRKEI